MPIPQTIIASPGVGSDHDELPVDECNSESQVLRIEDAEISRHRFAFSFDSEHPALRKSTADRHHAASHRRFATPIPRASHAHAPTKPKYYRGAASVEENARSSKKEGLKIDTSATQNEIEQSSRSSSDEDLDLHQNQPLQEDRFDQRHGCFDLCQWQY